MLLCFISSIISIIIMVVSISSNIRIMISSSSDHDVI